MKTNGNKRAPSGRARRHGTRRAYSTKLVALWLVLCFPAGLFFLWSNRCEWNRFAKTAISMLIAAALTIVLLPQTRPPERAVGGVVIVNASDDMIGPQPAEDFERINLYAYNVVTDSVLAEPEPTPEPVYVYCNDGGKYYHSADCAYVKNTSARVPHLQALNAGFKKCPDCNAPEAY